MKMTEEKLQKLYRVAALYYEQKRTQEEISNILEVSRPLISRMLSEAEKYNIVTITVNNPHNRHDSLVRKLQAIYGIKNALIVTKAGDDNAQNNTLIAQKLVEYLYDRHGNAKKIGIGWGTMVGEFIDVIEATKYTGHSVKHICPLIGNSSVSNRNYHSNENIRRLAESMNAEPTYLYSPAIFESESEMNIFKETASYHQAFKMWSELDTALVNIGNYPSSPDFASAFRLGDELKKRNIAGRILAYFYDTNGEIIHSPTDYTIQMPIEILHKTKNVIGVCSASTNTKAIEGALKSGLLTEIVLLEETVKHIV